MGYYIIKFWINWGTSWQNSIKEVLKISYQIFKYCYFCYYSNFWIRFIPFSVQFRIWSRVNDDIRKPWILKFHAYFYYAKLLVNWYPKNVLKQETVLWVNNLPRELSTYMKKSFRCNKKIAKKPFISGPLLSFTKLCFAFL